MLYAHDGYNYIYSINNLIVIIIIILTVVAILAINICIKLKKNTEVFAVISAYLILIMFNLAYFNDLGISTIYNDYDKYQPYITAIKVNRADAKIEVIQGKLRFNLDNINYYIDLNRNNCKYMEVVSDSQDSYYELHKDTSIEKLVLVKYIGTNENKAVNISTSSELVKFKEEGRDEVIL